MPITLPDISLKDIKRYPLQAAIVIGLVVMGFMVEKFLPDEKTKEAQSWREAFYVERRRSDSLQALLISGITLRDSVIAQQRHTIYKYNSRFEELGTQARAALNQKTHETRSQN